MNTTTTNHTENHRVDEQLVDAFEALFRAECTAERVAAAEHCPTPGFDPALWATLETNGFTLIAVPEAAGGSGGSPHDGAAMIFAAGEHAAPVPLADTSLAAGCLAQAGLAVPAAPMAVAFGSEVGLQQRPDNNWELSGTVKVPWGAIAEHFVVVVPTSGGTRLTALVAAAATKRTLSPNYAGEPSATVTFDGVAVDAAFVAESPASIALLRAQMAIGRSMLIAGGLRRAVELSIQYAGEREQFGKPIGKQQILQHYLAEMAGEAEVVRAATETAIDVMLSLADESSVLATVGAAKAVAGRAVGIVNRLAHQLHGAIGFTDEHRLQLTTRRLWSWRDEGGTETEWAALVGRLVCAQGGNALWPTLTTWPPSR